MNKNKDYYKILGINYNSDKKEIKKAYRQLARKLHPDINPGNKFCEEKFKEVGEAYSILIDDKKRLQYDILRGFINNTGPQSVKQVKKQAKKAYSSKTTAAPRKTKKKNNKFKANFGNFFKGFKAEFSKTFPKNSTEKKPHSEKTTKAPSQKGEDIITEISITITEAQNGTIRKVNILRTETCVKCKGKRTINGSSCNNCNGKGEKSSYKQLGVKIPAKVKEGSKIRIAKEGNKGINNGENGDLYLLVHIIKNSCFTFDGLHVFCEIPVTPTEVALGAEIQVPTIDGFINMKIPPETRSGQKFKLSGEGLPDANSGKRGDQVVTVRIELPSNLTEKEKELYKELAKMRKFNPREHLIFQKS